MTRQEAWEAAKDMLSPIFQKHELKEYRQGPPFGPSVIYTPSDQCISHIIRIADWLLEGEN